VTDLLDARRSTRRLPDAATPGVADTRLLPDEEFRSDWTAIVLPEKDRMLRTVVAGVRLRAVVPFAALPLHGVMLLTGPPGVGKTTVARGLADKVARTIRSSADWLFIEIDPHELASSSLGRSQRSVDELFGRLLDEHAGAGPTILLLDEVETLFTDRSALSMDANPIDVHRAVDAALTNLDRLARRHRDVVILATSNFPKAIDPALGSRADWIFDVPLPDREARLAILQHAVAAVTAVFPGAVDLSDPAVLERAVELAEGLDGRQLRKSVAAACALRPDAAGNPERVTGADLHAAIAELGGRL
jgi:SpoVK/Ycf46/Vps4 family AAA+-type ATPase